ncbi:hypothetical protein GCM10017600_56350 [Streptosporangium carneum]|uniref:Uncharacterized protein n=1 Tax=Streptosporangium carneum TaxID=47481 RepID=A0A9W6I557_9ACTN|nr:hypothetical protein GCM10017600_56350 [Streptosporangium carneum]
MYYLLCHMRGLGRDASQGGRSHTSLIAGEARHAGGGRGRFAGDGHGGRVEESRHARSRERDADDGAAFRAGSGAEDWRPRQRWSASTTAWAKAVGASCGRLWPMPFRVRWS